MGFVEEIINTLELNSNRREKIEGFLSTVSFYKIAPYVNYVVENNDKYKKFKKIINIDQSPCFWQKTAIKDKWDLVTYLYRYNIKLSIALYPYIYLIETTLKTKINNLMCREYSENWFKDESLFFKAYSLDLSIDKEIFDKYFVFGKIGKNEEKEIKEIYKNYQNQLKILPEKLTTSQIKAKIYKIKACIYLIKASRKAIKEKEKIEIFAFVENETTFGYWVSLIQNKHFWKESQVSLKTMFLNGEIKQEEINEKHSEISNKLDKIRILRNQISHHNQIIGIKENQLKSASKKFSLIQTYEDILYLFSLLGIDPQKDLFINELKCNQNKMFCKGRSFEILYNELKLMHNKI